MNVARLNILVTGGLFLLIVSYLWSGFEEPLMAMDEGMLLAYPEQIAHGKLPYRDFETYYPPGNLLVLLAAYKFSDFDVITERVVGLIYQLAIIGALFVTLRRWSLSMAAGAAILATLILKVAQLTAFAWWGGVACILWSIIALSSTASFWGIAVAGFLGGSAILFRQDLGPAVIASTLPFWLRLSGRDRARYLGFAVIALLPLLWITAIVGVRSIFDNLFVFPVLICNPARRLPFSESSFGPLVVFGLHVLAVVVNILASSMLVRQRRGSFDARLLLGVSLIGLAITPQALQRFDILHLAFAAICSLPVLPFSASWLLGRLANWHPSPNREFAILAITLGSLGAVAVLDRSLGRNYSISSDLYSAPLVVRDREIPIGDPILYKQLTRIAEILGKHSHQGQRIFVGPGDLRRTAFCDVYFYHLFPWLTPSSYFMEMNPLSANREGSRLANDIASADWVILNRWYERLREPNASNHLGPDAPNEVIRQQFKLHEEIGAFLVYERSGRGAALNLDVLSPPSR